MGGDADGGETDSMEPDLGDAERGPRLMGEDSTSPSSSARTTSRPAPDGGGSVGDGEEAVAPEPGAGRSPIELRGEDLDVGYPTTDEPVVSVDRILLPAGEVTALVGPNGSGKSTLLKALAKQLSPERGRVLLDGERIGTMGEKELARALGLLSQENDSPGSLAVEELAYHGRYPHRSFFSSLTEADHEAVDRAIELAGVEHLRDEELSNLSGGQKQLAWIAMVLAQDTDVLLLDEPTTFLDLHHQLRVMAVIRTMNEEAGVTVGIVLHDVGQAARFADNLIAMRDGALYDWGPPREVVTEALLADVFRVDADVDAESTTGPHIAPHRALEE